MAQSSPLLSDDDIFGATAPQSGLLSDDDIFGLPSGPSSAPGAMSYGFPVPNSPINSFLSAASSAPALQDRIASAGGSFMQGAGQTISGIPRAIAIAGAPNLDVLESFDRIDRGEERRFRSGPSGRFSSPGDLVVPPGQAGDVVDRYQAASTEERQAIRAELRARAEGVVNSPAYQAGEAVDQWFAENFPSDPEFQDDFWTSQVPAGLGSAVSFMVAALATRGASSGVGATAEALATFAAPAALGSSLNATDLFSDALSNGADIQDALKAADRGAVVGLSEAVPIFDLLKRTDRVTGGAIRRYLVRAIEQGSEEAVQEAFQGVMNAAIAQDLYDPERGVWTMDRVDESAVGFTTGALLETITSIILPGRQRSGGSRDNQASDDAPAADEVASSPLDATIPEARDPSSGNPTVSEVRDFAQARIAELQTVSQPSESEAAELAFLTENQDNAQVVASAYGVELQPELLSAPVIAVNSEGQASTAAQADDLARELQTRARDLGLDEVSTAQIGRVPPPDMAAPAEPAQMLALPAPQTVVTPQGEIGTPAQFDARDRAERERRTQLGLDEVANARVDMQPRAEPAGLREQARLAAPQLSDSDLASPIPNDLISHGRAILADAEGAVGANRILDSAGLPPINTEITITTPQGPTRARIDDAATVDGATSVSLRLPDGRVVRESAARVAQAIQTQPRALDVSGAARIDTTAETAPLPVRAPVLDGQIARSLGPQIGQSSAAVTEGVSPAPRAPVTVREVPDSADVAATPTGRRVPVRYALVEAGSLVSSQLADGRTNPAYPAELQPRDRSRAASEVQVRKILDPNEFDPRQLGRSPTAGSGAPIISPEGVVESGNGRTMALSRAYQAGGEVSQRYRDYLEGEGFDTQGMSQPILVRVRDGAMSPQDLQAYTREANTPDIMGMSATEQAMADGAAIPDAMLDLYRGGDVDAVANRPFVREFISRVVGNNASASMIARDGSMNTEAIRRIGGALLAKSYGNTGIVEAMTESTDSNIKAIGGALMDVAPLWAKMRGDAASGQSAADMDNTPLLLEAVAIVDRARRERRSIAEYVNQTDMLSGGAIDPITEGFLGLMYHNVTGWTRPVGRNKLAAALRFYIEEAGKTQPGSDMFGQSAPAAGDIIKLARERTIQNDQDARDGPNLFAPATERPGERPRADSQGGVQSDIPQPPAEARGEAAQRGEAGAGQRGVGEPGSPQQEAPVDAPSQEGDVREAVSAATEGGATVIDAAESGTGPGTEMFRLRPSDTLAANGADVAEALADQLSKAGLSDRIALKVRDRIEALADGTIAEADGRYIKGVIEIALDAPSPSRALNHEIIHALRDMGLFRDAEWRTLSRSAMENAGLMSTVRQRYEGLDLSQDAVVEEAVAEMYADWAQGRQERRGFIKAAFERIASFFEALANGLRGNGFQTSSDVFGRVEDGETAARSDSQSDESGERFALRGGDFSQAQAERAISSILKRDTRGTYTTVLPDYAAVDGTITPDGGQLDNTVWKKPLALFESATDKLRRSGDDALVDLGNRVDGYFDKNEARIGQVNGPLRPILKKLGVGVTSGQGAIEKVTAPFREYWRHMDNGRIAQAEAVLKEADEAIRELVEAVKDLFSDMGTQNQQAGVQVFDAKTNGWRPIGKLPRGGFWPRSLDPKVQAVLQNPSADTALWGRMVDALLNEGHIETREEAKRFLSTYFTNEVKNDYFAGIEKARSVRLPEIFYDYSWGAFQRYAFKWSARISQIEAFGQGSVFDRAGPPAAKNVFSEIIGATLDKNTRDYVGQVAQHVYSVRTLDGYTALLDNLNLLATGTQLGNPATATLNLIGGTQLNVQQFGWRRVAKAWGELVTDWDNLQQKGVELGILGKDVLNILRDTEHNDAYFDSNRKIRDALGEFTRLTMTWGGYRGTENLIRATGMIAGRYQLNDALKAWNANPASEDSLKYRAYMRRNRIDPDLLLRENGEGLETARYLRLMVNIPQGSYRIDQTPLYVDSQLGKFLFKYQKFGTQVSRMFWQHFMQPFVQTFAAPGPGRRAASGAERVKKFLPLLHWFSAAAVGGTAILAARSFLFNYGDPGTDWDDLADALEDDDLAAKWAMIFDRAWYSMMAGSAFGFFGNYMQMGRDVADQQRVKSPLDPPGLASIDSVVELVQRFLEQGTLSGRDIDQIAEGTFAIYRGYKRAGLTAIEMTGLDVAEARLQTARRENRYIRSAARRFADETGIEARRTSTGRIGRTPRSPLNSAVSEALLVGDGARARLLVQDAMAKASGPQERAQIRSSLRASIRYRQPILVNGPPSAAVRRDFLLWARENTSPANYHTIIEADRRYRNAARVAGVW